MQPGFFTCVASRRARTLAPALVLLGCGSTAEPDPTWTAGAADRFCQAAEDHAKQCPASTGCGAKIAEACAESAKVLSDPYVTNLADCTDTGDAPLSCLSSAASGLQPTEAHAAFAKQFCAECAPSTANCADTFFTDPEQHAIAELVLPLNEVGLEAVTSCAHGADCAEQFGACARKALAEKGIPSGTVGCLVDAWAGSMASPASGCEKEAAPTNTTGPNIESVCLGQTIALFPLDHVGGDYDFVGHGPNVHVWVDVSAPSATEIAFKACVNMKETEWDWTAGTKCVTKTLMHPNAGIAGETHFGVTYTDSDTYPDDAIAKHKTLVPAGYVQSVKCRGDNVGSDICSSSTCSRCDVEVTCVEVNAL